MLELGHAPRRWGRLTCRSACVLAAAAAILFAGAGGAAGQSASAARSEGRPPAATASPAEIPLARSAAPSSISGGAAVYVLDGGRYRLAEKGTNGFTCFVLRDEDPRARYPTCMDPEWTRCQFPEYRKEAELRHAGMPEAKIAAILDRMRRGGQFPRPRRAGIAYMASSQMRGMYDVVPGGRIQPHVMIYAAGATNAQIGVRHVASARRLHIPFVQAEGRPDVHILVPLMSYTDGTRFEDAHP